MLLAVLTRALVLQDWQTLGWEGLGVRLSKVYNSSGEEPANPGGPDDMRTREPVIFSCYAKQKCSTSNLCWYKTHTVDHCKLTLSMPEHTIIGVMPAPQVVMYHGMVCNWPLDVRRTFALATCLSGVVCLMWCAVMFVCKLSWQGATVPLASLNP